jgi:hypothetical protein
MTDFLLGLNAGPNKASATTSESASPLKQTPSDIPAPNSTILFDHTAKAASSLLPIRAKHEAIERGWQTRPVTHEYIFEFNTAINWPSCRRLLVGQFIRRFLFDFCCIVNETFHRMHIVFDFCSLLDEESEPDRDDISTSAARTDASEGNRERKRCESCQGV